MELPTASTTAKPSLAANPPSANANDDDDNDALWNMIADAVAADAAPIPVDRVKTSNFLHALLSNGRLMAQPYQRLGTLVGESTSGMDAGTVAHVYQNLERQRAVSDKRRQQSSKTRHTNTLAKGAAHAPKLASFLQKLGGSSSSSSKNDETKEVAK